MNELISRIKELPAFPTTILKLIRALSDEGVSSRDISLLLEKDQSLSGKILKIANSPYYNRGLEIRSIRQAVVFLGLELVKEIILTTNIISNLKIKIGKDVYDIKTFWEHSVATAFISKWLAKEFEICDPYEAYSLGLLHDYGKIAFAVLSPEKYREVVEEALKGERNYIEIEREIFGLHHGEFGKLISEKWNLPEIYGEVMMYHHGFSDEDELKNPLMVALVGFSNIFSKQIGFYFPWEYKEFILRDDPFWNYLAKNVKKLSDIDEVLFTLKMEEQSVKIEKLVKTAMEG